MGGLFKVGVLLLGAWWLLNKQAAKATDDQTQTVKPDYSPQGVLLQVFAADWLIDVKHVDANKFKQASKYSAMYGMPPAWLLGLMLDYKVPATKVKGLGALLANAFNAAHAQAAVEIAGGRAVDWAVWRTALLKAVGEQAVTEGIAKGAGASDDDANEHSQ